MENLLFLVEVARFTYAQNGYKHISDINTKTTLSEQNQIDDQGRYIKFPKMIVDNVVRGKGDNNNNDMEPSSGGKNNSDTEIDDIDECQMPEEIYPAHLVGSTMIELHTQQIIMRQKLVTKKMKVVYHHQ